MTKKLFGALCGVCLLSFIAQLFVQPHLPALVPTNWGISGQPDTWGPKSTNLWLSLLPLAATIFFYILPLFDPRRANYKKHSKAYSSFIIALVAFFICLIWAVNAASFGMRLPVSFIITVLTGILFVVLGNFMPQIRPNFFFGIRTPWALDNETVWRKTHRLGGVLFFAAGVLIAISAFLPGVPSLVVVLATTLSAGIIPIVYSFIIYTKISKEENRNNAKN